MTAGCDTGDGAEAGAEALAAVMPAVELATSSNPPTATEAQVRARDLIFKMSPVSGMEVDVLQPSATNTGCEPLHGRLPTLLTFGS